MEEPRLSLRGCGAGCATSQRLLLTLSEGGCGQVLLHRGAALIRKQVPLRKRTSSVSSRSLTRMSNCLCKYIELIRDLEIDLPPLLPLLLLLLLPPPPTAAAARCCRRRRRCLRRAHRPRVFGSPSNDEIRWRPHAGPDASGTLRPLVAEDRGKVFRAAHQDSKEDAEDGTSGRCARLGSLRSRASA